VTYGKQPFEHHEVKDKITGQPDLPGGDKMIEDIKNRIDMLVSRMQTFRGYL
jgi:hypothetical protein